jgi:hypothetical protein
MPEEDRKKLLKKQRREQLRKEEEEKKEQERTKLSQKILINRPKNCERRSCCRKEKSC